MSTTAPLASIAAPNVPRSPREASGRQLAVRVHRSDPGARGEFNVQLTDPVTVLDVLLEIHRSHDPSLAFRYSCRVAMCGTCGVRVNGRSTLACMSVIAPAHKTVEIAPLAGLPVTRDLVVDMRPFWDQWARVMPWFVPSERASERVRIDSEEDHVLQRTLGCISCGACYSTCEVAGGRRNYIGPAALNRALALIADPRDEAAEDRLAVVAGDGGVDCCHYIDACTSACPVSLDPARSIAELRRMRLRAHA